MALKPDLVFTFLFRDPEHNTHPKLEELNIRTAILANQPEATPLGSAEWLKYFALFFNRERDMEKYFDEIAHHYESLADRAKKAPNKPKVIEGAIYSDNWIVNGDRANLIADAGGDYYWPEATTSRWYQMVTYEAALERGVDADFWVYAPRYTNGIDDLLKSDNRFALLKAVKRGEVYNVDAQLDEHRRNPYLSQFLARPDLVLADLVKIFHPELVPDHRLVFFRKLGPASQSIAQTD
jgi:iron complex transport system substrate-binding protein